MVRSRRDRGENRRGSPLRIYQGVQDYRNLKGLVSDDGKKKAAFAVRLDYDLELAEGGT